MSGVQNVRGVVAKGAGCILCRWSVCRPEADGPRVVHVPDHAMIAALLSILEDVGIAPPTVPPEYPGGAP